MYKALSVCYYFQILDLFSNLENSFYIASIFSGHTKVNSQQLNITSSEKPWVLSFIHCKLSFCVFHQHLVYDSVTTRAHYPLVFFFPIFFNVYLFLRDRDRERMGEGQRERETQNLKLALGSELSVQSPTWGSNSQTARS